MTKMGLTPSLHDSYGPLHLYICHSLFEHSTFLSLYFMFCNKEEFQKELSRKIVLWQIFIGHRSASFPLLSACHLAEFDSSIICIVEDRQGPFLLQDMLLRSSKSPRICFRVRKHEIYREDGTCCLFAF